MNGRRAVRRGRLVALIVVGLVMAPVGWGYARLCTAPVDTFPVVAAASRSAATEAKEAGERAPESWGARVAAMRARALERVLVLKQSDEVAFPLHVVAGRALETGRCRQEATVDQWRKAAMHAWSDKAAATAAAGLTRTVDGGAGVGTALAVVERAKVEQSRFADNLARVQMRLE